MATQAFVVNREQVPYHIGDTIVHPQHGIGVITRLEELTHEEQPRLFYVIATHDDHVTLWVPVDAAARCGLRPVASTSRFMAVLGILGSAAQPLSDQPRERQVEINERLSQGTLEALCSTIRDLSAYGQNKRLNEHDAKVLKRARKLLLDEWALVMHTLQDEAQTQLGDLLHQSAGRSKHETKR